MLQGVSDEFDDQLTSINIRVATFFKGDIVDREDPIKFDNESLGVLVDVFHHGKLFWEGRKQAFR